MRRLTIAAIAVSTIVFTQIASAADLPRKAPAYTPPPPPILTWNGWYGGLNAGGIWANNSDFDNTATSFGVGGAASNVAAAAAMAAAVPLSFDTGNKAGFIGGGQFGYNYQTGAVVWGVETDIQGTSLRGSASAFNQAPIVGFEPATADVSSAANSKLDVFGTLRARLGWTPSPPWLIYATGGLAYGHVDTNVAFTSHINGCNNCGPDPVAFAENAKWRAGWTAGGGVEWMFAPQWSAKLEYLYYDLGHVTLNTALNQTLVPSGIVCCTAAIASEIHYRGSIARVGVNYHF
jgi:outer membrane immunogenic protein